MDERCLAHVLTADERARFECDGYLMLPRALAAAKVAELLEVVDRHDAAYRREPGVGPHHVLNLHDLVGRDDAFLELVDWPATFPKVWGVLGWNIQLFHTQGMVSPPSPRIPGLPKGRLAWHQDNNRMNRDIETPAPHPRVSLKLGYFLTDLPGPEMANFCLVPGSHRRQRLEFEGDGVTAQGELAVTARAGDAILFDRRLWHSGSANFSDVTRKVLFYGYSYRWLRPKSAMHFPELLARVDPIRRQLLGFATSANGYFDPQPADVPLREWIREKLGAEAVAP
jgi:hypothetical protein